MVELFIFNLAIYILKAIELKIIVLLLEEESDILESSQISFERYLMEMKVKNSTYSKIIELQYIAKIMDHMSTPQFCNLIMT